MQTDEWKQAERAKVFNQSFEYGIKQRHGMFSMPVSTAIGDDSRFKSKTANKDPETGKPIIGPNNFGIIKPKKGKDESVYFST